MSFSAHDNTTVPFSHSAAGHNGISTDSTGSLLIKPCTQAEIDFYESASSHPDFMAHMPVYMGSLVLGTSPAAQQLSADAAEVIKGMTTNDSTQEWKPSGGAKLDSGLAIVLSNATAGFKCPNVLDLKLGARLWDDDAPEAKRKKLDEVSKSSTSASLGFRIAGMKVWIGDGTIAAAGIQSDAGGSSKVTDVVMQEVNTKLEGGYKIFDKFYGRNNIRTENVKKGFEEFLSSTKLPSRATGEGADERKKVMLDRLRAEIESIQDMLEKVESRMYSASILMVYEGDPNALDEALKREKEQVDREETEDDEGIEDEDEVEKHKVHEVVLIDFAHAHWTPGEGPDENVLHGVRSIRKILEDM